MGTLWESLKVSFSELGNTVKEITLGQDPNSGDASFGSLREALSSTNQGFSATSGKYLSRKDSLMHYLVVSGSGAGKTVNTIIPGILHQQNASIIILDNSGEIYTKTAEAKRRDGYCVLNLDFGTEIFTEATTFYNPLSRIKKGDKTAMAALIKILIGNTSQDSKNQFWNTKSEEVINLALSILLQEVDSEKITLHNLLRIVEFMASNEEAMSNHIVQMEEAIFQKWKLLLSNASNTLDSIRSSAIAVLSWIGLNDNLAKLTSKDNINLDDFRHRKVALYIRVPIQNETSRPLVNIFFAQFFNHFLSRPVPHPDERMIMIFGDEFGSIHIPNWPTILSNSRKFLLPTQMIVQSEAQLEEVYGKSGKTIIMANCSKLYLGGGIDEEADSLSQRLGTKTITDVKTGHTKQVPLMTAFQIRTLKDKALFFRKGGEKPVCIPLKPYYKVKSLKKITELERPEDQKSIPIDVPLHLFTPKTIKS